MRNIFIIGVLLLAIYLVRGILIKQAAWEAAETEAMEAQPIRVADTLPLSVENYFVYAEAKMEQNNDSYVQEMSVDNFYDYIVEKNPDLQQFESDINDFRDRDSLLTPFKNFNEPSQTYYQSVYSSLELSSHASTEGSFKAKAKALIEKSQKQYKNTHAEWFNLLKSCDDLKDYYLLLKINQTLPLIEQYQKEKGLQWSDLQEAKKLLLQKAVLQKQIDSLMKKQ